MLKPCRNLVVIVLVTLFLAAAHGQVVLPARVVTLDHGVKDPAISPDGAQIAVSILGKIWIVPRAGGDARQVSDGVSWDTNPAWSPDGRFLAYAYTLPGGSDLAVKNLLTGHTQLIYHSNEVVIQQIEFAPRTDTIFFLGRRSQYECHLWRISMDGSEPRQITEAVNWHENSFALSPDGKRVFLDSGRYGGSNLYMLELESLKTQRLTRNPYNQGSVQWSVDGKQVAYVDTTNGRQSVMVADPALSRPRAVVSNAYRDEQLVLDPDGHTAVVASARKLYRLDLNSGDLQPIPFIARFVLPQNTPADLLITHARLLTAKDALPVDNASIEIRGGKIAAVYTSGQMAPSGMPVIDAAGKTVMPGLMDNHYHFWDIFDGPRLLARGITSIRDPGSDLADTMDYKEAIALDLVAGPHIYTAGPLIDGLGGYHPMVDVEIDDPAAAPDLVRALKEQGVDALKVYFMLKPEVLRAVVKEAHEQGLRVTGHIGVRTSWTQAMDDNIDGFNHIRLWPDFLPASDQPQGDNESLDTEKNPVARMQSDWSKIDPKGDHAKKIIEQMAEHHVGFDPTLSIQRVGEYWRKSQGLEQYEVSVDTYRRMGEFVARAQRMGVMLLAGTDDGSLFDEMEAYANAGVPGPEIVKSATINGARWLGKDAEFGTIERGKRADLLIIDGDPLRDIKNMRRIITVIQDGRVVFRK